MTQTIARQTTANLASDWPANWNNFLDSLLTAHTGAARPAYAQAGTLWFNAATKYLNYYDGTQDIALFAIDATNHLLNPPIGGGVASLASAGTVDIGSVPQSALSITGTTAITSLGTSMKPGQIKALSFTGTLTLTNGASLILPGGANITTANGDNALVVCTSAGNYRVLVYQVASVAPSIIPGTIIMWGGSAAPSNFLECDGSAISRATYSSLFSAIGTTWGAGDGSSTFNLPDMRGQFVRGWDHGRGVDSGRALGSSQADAFGSHNHAVTDPGHGHSATVTDPGHTHTTTAYNSSSTGGGFSGGGNIRLVIPAITSSSNPSNISVGVNGSGTGISIQANGSTETRPKNVALMYCIRY